MAIQFRCSGCTSLIKIGDEFAGRKVRCPKCQAVVLAPEAALPAAPPPVASAFMEVTPVEPLPETPPAPPPSRAAFTERPREPVAVAGIPLHDEPPPTRLRAFEVHDEVRPDERSSGFPVALALGLGGGALLLIAGVAVALLWVLADASPEPAPDAGPVVVAEAVREHRAKRDEKRLDDGWKDDKLVVVRDKEVRIKEDVKDDAFKEVFKEGVFKDDFVKDDRFKVKDDLPKDVKEGFPIKEPDKEMKKTAKPPADSPMFVVLDKGRFATEVLFDPKVGDAINVLRKFEFDAKPGTVYLAKLPDGFRNSLRVHGPGIVVADKDFFDKGSKQLAFLSAGGRYTVTVVGDRFELKACNLEISEMDGTEPLPFGVRVKAGDVPLPEVARVKELNVYDKQFSAAAFSFDSKFFLMAHGDQTLSYWELPGVVEKGSFHAKERLSGMAVDSKGRLYAQLTPSSGPFSLGKPNVGDLHVWDNAKPSGSKVALPAPTKSLPIGGIVQRLVSSPDGRWLYYLDSHNRKVGRIDVEGPTLDKTIDTLSAGAVAMSLTPDGKKIYVASSASKIDVIDTAGFKLERTVSLDRGKPSDIAATNEGVVYLVADKLTETKLFAGTSAMAADLRNPAALSVKLILLGVAHHCRFVEMLPDQRGVLFSGDRQITVCAIPAQPALIHSETKTHWIRDYFMPGFMVLSRDGRTLLQDTGVILSVSR